MKQKIVLIVAVVAGLLAALLTRTYLTSKDTEYRKLKADFTAKHQTFDVLCFAKDVLSGTVIQKADLYEKTVPKSGLNGQALTRARARHRGAAARERTAREGSALLVRHRGRQPLRRRPCGRHPQEDARRLHQRLGRGGGERHGAPERPCGRDRHLLLPEDGPDGKTVVQELVTCTILQNVLVLATGKDTAKSAPCTSRAAPPTPPSRWRSRPAR